MKIEIAEPGRMAETGSSLVKLIQNNDMPVLDLLVRESIQNSLDAKKTDSKYIYVNFITGSFDSKTLAGELEGISEKLIRNFHGKSDYIAVRDTNTLGLTGETDFKNVKNNEYGNLIKLVYDICKPQDAAGAGGSWGIGKTVFFRIGIGLVLYYSRIKKAGGIYESRLAAALVEDEASDDAMIPVYKGQTKRGIAFWGRSAGENETQPLTDEKEIRKILKIFGIPEYKGDDTGTTVIIPYTDSEKLLSDSMPEYEGGKTAYWHRSIEDYLRISVQRWYSPRLNNPVYPFGAFLKAKINDEGLSLDSMEPVFRIIQSLYNRALNTGEHEDFFSKTGIVPLVSPVHVAKYLDNTTAGNVAYVSVSKSLLEMNAPNNKPDPYKYLNCKNTEEDTNRPVVCFTRQPGMIVSFETDSAWTKKIPSSEKNEYIFAVFVLNSMNRLKNRPSDMKLEEYIRKSEKADHTSWTDWNDGKERLHIAEKIQNNVSILLGNSFAPRHEGEARKQNSGLGKWLADLLLPPDGFGKAPGSGLSMSGGNQKRTGSRGKRKGISFRPEFSEITFSTGEMIIPFILESVSKDEISSAFLQIQIDSEAGKIEVEKWETEMHLQAPFAVREFTVEVMQLDGESHGAVLSIPDNENSASVSGLEFRKKRTAAGTCDGLEMTTDVPSSMRLRITAAVMINRNDIKPAFVLSGGKMNGR